VIVPARDARDTLPRTLAALARQDAGGDYEVIVIDDGSSDGTAEVARQASSEVRVVTIPPSGPAGARNRGAQISSGEALAFCDADVFPTAGWLRAGLDALASVELVQGGVLPDPSIPLGPFDRSIWVTSEGGLWESANLFVTRELFERVGGFPDAVGPRNGKPLAEDVLFGYRAERLGARHSFCPQALAHHAVFRRSWCEYVTERRRLEYFPAIAREAPELRGGFMYRRLFLNGRTARLDLGLAGAALGLATGSALPWLGGLPYLRSLYAHARRAGSMGPAWPAIAAADFAADLAGLAAMAYGSVRYRSPVL
jgi:glycosyltransferase involved in cell wall biosynthesis